jgi:cytochrome c5
MEKKKIWVMNGVFAAVCAAILIFLLNAPEETTAPLPKDEIHAGFYDIKGKKAAEKFCGQCHDNGKEAPLPKDHPPKYRCLFCHKRN